MAFPFDGHAELCEAIVEILQSSDLTSEDLGRIILTVDGQSETFWHDGTPITAALQLLDGTPPI